LYTEINKANQRIYELEEENKELKIKLVQKDKEIVVIDQGKDSFSGVKEAYE